MKKLDLRILQAVVLTFEERSITKAAMRMDISQPSMSRLISRARVFFDDPLFLTSPHRVVPTARASEVTDQCRAVLASIETLRKPSVFDPKTDTRTFSISATDYIGKVVLAPIIGQLIRAAPEASFRIHDRRENILLKRDDSCHVAIGSFPKPEDDFRRIKLYRESFLSLARKGHPLSKKQRSLADFLNAKHLLVTIPDAGRSAIDEGLKRHGSKPREVVVRTPHFLSTPDMLRETDLVTTLPTRLANALAEQYDLFTFKPPLKVSSFTVWMMWHERMQLDPAHRWLRQQITRAIR